MTLQNLVKVYCTEFNPNHLYGLVTATCGHRNDGTARCFTK